MDRHPRQQPAVYSVTITGPFDSSGAGDTTSRRRIFTCRPDDRGTGAGCAKRIISTLTRRAYRRPVTDEDLKTPLAFYEQGYAEGGFETGMEMALRKILIAPEFLFRVEQDPPKPGRRLSHQRCRAGVAAFVLPLEQHSGRRTARCGGARETARLRRCSSSRCAACWPTRDPRRSSTTSPASGCISAISPRLCRTARMFPMFDDNLRQAFKQETELFFESVIRENRSVLDLLRADYTFLDERLAKHYGIGGRVRHAVQARDAAGRQRARRAAWTGQHSARDLLRQPHVAGAARQMGARKHHRHAAAGASAGRAAAEGSQKRGSRSDDARADGAAPRESGLLVVPHADGSDRAVDGELRRDRPLAHQRARTARRSTRRAACRTATRSKASPD